MREVAKIAKKFVDLLHFFFALFGLLRELILPRVNYTKGAKVSNVTARNTRPEISPERASLVTGLHRRHRPVQTATQSLTESPR